jgi:hypothetical protein
VRNATGREQASSCTAAPAQRRGSPNSHRKTACTAGNPSPRQETTRLALIGGTANSALAAGTATALDVPLAACTVRRFPDGEVAVELEESVRGRDAFILLSTALAVNDHLVAVLALADACRRADASRITAIVPYFGYARSDKRRGHRTPVMARLVADLMQAAGVEHVVRHECGPAVDTIFDKFEQVPVFAISQGGQAPVVQNEEIDIGKLVKQLAVGAVGSGADQAKRGRNPWGQVSVSRL